MPSGGFLILGPGPTDEEDGWPGEHHGVPWALAEDPQAGLQRAGASYPKTQAVALCHGWINGQKGKLDDGYWLQRFAPRKPGSKWPRTKGNRAAALIEVGQMRPAGLREVEMAQADGRWGAAHEPQSTAAVPNDLAQALAGNDAGCEFFVSPDSTNRHAILYQPRFVHAPPPAATRATPR